MLYLIKKKIKKVVIDKYSYIVFFVLTLRLAVILMGKITGKYVNEKHRSTEAIINPGKAPKEWSNKLRERISSAGKIEG